MAEIYDIYYLSPATEAAEARRLAESIQRYRLPPKVKLPDTDRDYRRAAFDFSGEEMDEALSERLEQSRNLLLFCSPETKNDPVILKKLAHFRKIHGREKIIACMVRGEPVDAFPESFIEKKKVRRIMPDMSVVESIDTIEPVAADLRGNTEKRRRELLRYETVRITASVLGLHPDELEQRHRARRRKALTAVLSVVGAVSLAAAAVFLRLGWIAKNEGEIAEQQAQLSAEIAQRTLEKLPEAFADDPAALNYINEALENARSGLEELGLADLLDGEAEG